MTRKKLLIAMILLAAPPLLRAADWPQWGGDSARNMVSEESGLPIEAEVGKSDPKTKEIDLATTQNVKWVAKLGGQTYGNPTVAGGKVFVGTNNQSPRDPNIKHDHGVLLCFNEADGAFLWQLLVPKLAAGKVSDWDYTGLCSSPAVEGDRIYVVTNRCEVICLDINGLADGNAGPFTDEAQYVAGPGKPPAKLGEEHADIIWRFDMRDELGVFPHNMASSSVLIVGDRIYANTSNSVDWTGKHTPAPDAPALICLDKETGALLGEEQSGIGARLFNSSWSSPAYGEFDGRGLVIFGGGDGWCYAFDPAPVDGLLREVWRFDCNPKGRRLTKDGNPQRYRSPSGPSEIISTPVISRERVYVSVGQAPENGDGAGALSCIDGTKTGHITETGKVWQYDELSRSMSTASIADGLVYIADYRGKVHCLDEETGEVVWIFDTEGHVWGSTLLADGKIFVGNENGLLTVLQAGRQESEEPLSEIDFGSPLYSTPVAANGVLFVATERYLYALENDKRK